MKLILSIYILISFAYMQEPVPNDSLLANQKRILENQNIILEEVVYVDPLEGKSFGIELNPVYLLMASTKDEGIALTGTVSFFNLVEHAEIAFPFFYGSDEKDLKQIIIDGHYRNFLGKHRGGFYISSGIRFTHFRGRDENFLFDANYWNNKNEIKRYNRIGLVFGIGFRKFGYNGWYWGCSLFGGRYVTNDNAKMLSSSLGNNKIILDVEFLKFGKSF